METHRKHLAPCLAHGGAPRIWVSEVGAACGESLGKASGSNSRSDTPEVPRSPSHGFGLSIAPLFTMPARRIPKAHGKIGESGILCLLGEVRKGDLNGMDVNPERGVTRKRKVLYPLNTG